MKEYMSHMPVEKEVRKEMGDASKATQAARIGRRHDNMIKAIRSKVSKDVCRNFKE